MLLFIETVLKLPVPEDWIRINDRIATGQTIELLSVLSEYHPLEDQVPITDTSANRAAPGFKGIFDRFPVVFIESPPHLFNSLSVGLVSQYGKF
jgi:hypothetical protein